MKNGSNLLVAVLISGVSLAVYSALVESHIISSQVWFGIVLPIAIVLANTYIILSGNIRRDRVRTWVAAVLGMLLMSISPLLSLIGVIVFGTGFFLLIFGIRRTFKHK